MLQWISLGLKFLPMIIGAVHAVEKIADPAKKGKEKQDAALAAVREMLLSSEGGDVADLLDAETEDAIRKTIDAYVALQNVIAKKRAAKA